MYHIPVKNPVFVSLKQIPEDEQAGKSISYPDADHIFKTHSIYLSTAHVTKNNNLFRYQLHNGMEILYITKGSGTLYLTDGEQVLSEGDIAVINPYEAHNFAFDMHVCERLCVAFFPKVLLSDLYMQEKTIEAFFTNKYHVRNLILREDPLQPAIAALLEEIMEKCRVNSKCLSVELYSLVLQIIAVILNHDYVNAVKPNSVTPPIIYDVLHYIDSHPYAEINTMGIANHIGYSTAHFCREFKKYFGITFTEYMQELKINKAKQILIETPGIPLDQLASMVGYNNTTYFSQIFKKSTGFSPGKFCDASQTKHWHAE